ncbi:hypothetical protein [uncultured Metabacillus sp.]|uniref:hypothetical protein n=1 Tax=uncultured Metabacillus sp. TaxID=2860135 RepID=UPI00261A575C|nr:hypothetical protein [uncultured Metabacillus sp.]
MFRVEKQLDENITITVTPEAALTLHSILEFFTRFDSIEDKATDTEINMATIISEELETYIKDDVSEKIETEVIDYINGSYNFDPKEADKFVELMAKSINKSGSVKF